MSPTQDWTQKQDLDEAKSLISRLNVAVPLCIAIFAGFYASYRPLQKWVSVYAAAKRLEAELWKYRCRVGRYSVFSVRRRQGKRGAEAGGGAGAGAGGSGASASGMNGAGGGGGFGSFGAANGPSKTIRELFARAVEDIWTVVANSDVNTLQEFYPPSPFCLPLITVRGFKIYIPGKRECLICGEVWESGHLTRQSILFHLFIIMKLRSYFR